MGPIGVSKETRREGKDDQGAAEKRWDKLKRLRESLGRPFLVQYFWIFMLSQTRKESNLHKLFWRQRHYHYTTDFWRRAGRGVEAGAGGGEQMGRSTNGPTIGVPAPLPHRPTQHNSPEEGWAGRGEDLLGQSPRAPFSWSTLRTPQQGYPMSGRGHCHQI